MVKKNRLHPAYIRSILDKANREGLIRFINGDTLDCRKSNLQRVTVLESFQNKDWVVDADCVLTEKEYEVYAKVRQDWDNDMSLFQ